MLLNSDLGLGLCFERVSSSVVALWWLVVGESAGERVRSNTSIGLLGCAICNDLSEYNVVRCVLCEGACTWCYSKCQRWLLWPWSCTWNSGRSPSIELN